MSRRAEKRPEDSCTFCVKVKPGARQTGIAGVHDGRLVIQVAAAPERGRANAAVIKALAKALGVAPSAVTLASGQTGRVKRISVDGVSPDQYDTLFRRYQRPE